MTVNTAQVNNITGDNTSNAFQLISEYNCNEKLATHIIANDQIGATINFCFNVIFGLSSESSTVIVIRPLRFVCMVLIPVGSVFLLLF